MLINSLRLELQTSMFDILITQDNTNYIPYAFHVWQLRSFYKPSNYSANTVLCASVFFTGQDMLLYLGENLCGALFHLLEMPLLKFFQPHPVALEECECPLFHHFSTITYGNKNISKCLILLMAVRLPSPKWYVSICLWIQSRSFIISLDLTWNMWYRISHFINITMRLWILLQLDDITNCYEELYN